MHQQFFDLPVVKFDDNIPLAKLVLGRRVHTSRLPCRQSKQSPCRFRSTVELGKFGKCALFFLRTVQVPGSRFRSRVSYYHAIATWQGMPPDNGHQAGLSRESILPIVRATVNWDIPGYSAAGPYGAFVSPDGDLTSLTGLPGGPGFLDGAALDNSGVAIVGGTSADVPFAALVAPDGTLTFLDGLPSQGQINSISIAA
jgi:hypothetical protein